MSLNPETARIAISEAEARTQERQTHQMKLLIVALIALTIIAASSSAGFLITYGQAHNNGLTAKKILALTESVAVLQSQVVTATAIAQIATNRLLDCTTPEGKCLHDLQSQSGGAIASLNQTAAQGRQDLLRKLAELFQALGVPQSVVNHVLSEPAPTPSPFVVPQPSKH